MTTVHFDYTNQNIQGLIRSMFLNTNPNGTLKHTSTIKHQTAHNVNLDLFVDSLHDKLARIFCVINRAGGLNITLPCPKTVEEDDLFDLQSKNPPANKTDEKVIEHFINSVVTKTVIPLFDNINQNELRIKDIFKFFFLLCFSNLLDPADTSGENFIKHLRTKLNSPNITLPFQAPANGGIFTILSNEISYSVKIKILEFLSKFFNKISKFFNLSNSLFGKSSSITLFSISSNFSLSCIKNISSFFI